MYVYECDCVQGLQLSLHYNTFSLVSISISKNLVLLISYK